MPLLLVALLAAAEPATLEASTEAPAARLMSPEVSAGVGLLGAGYTGQGPRWGDLHVAPVVTGRYLIGGFTTEAGVLLVVPTSRETTGLSFTAGLTVGWTGRRWSLAAGALMQWSSLARPAIEWLPQLRLSYDFGLFGATFGLFDQLGLVPAHLSADLRWRGRKFSLGWVAPIGVMAGADLPLGGRLGLRLNGFAFKLAQSEYAMLTVGGTFDGGAR